MESSRSSRSTTTKLPGTLSPPATTAPQAFSTYNESETPFFKKLNQPIKLESNGGQLSSFLASPTATEVSINPFHPLGQQNPVSKTLSQPPSRPAFSKPLSSTAAGGHRPVLAWSEEGQYSIVDYTENNHGGYGCEPFGGETGGEQSIYGQPHQRYEMSTQQIPYYQHSSSTANVRGFAQQQLVPSRDSNAGETRASYCCSGSAQPSGNGQQYSRTGVGGYGNLHDALARSASGFLGAVGKNDDPCGGYSNSLKVSGGPSPALDQPGGRPESVVNNMQGQTGLPPRS
ncbi:RNAPII degradation factor [Lobaria immixta]|nr:RNAPII degradation factor [Lobaria immixta]